MSRKQLLILMLIVAAVDMTTIASVTVYASAQEEKIPRNVAEVSEPVEVIEESMEVETETEEEKEDTNKEETPEYDESISASLVTLYQDLLSGDYVYEDLTFHFGHNGSYAGFFDDANRNVLDYSYEVIGDGENTLLNIYNENGTEMVSYYLVFSDDYEEITLIYTEDASLKLHLKAADAKNQKSEDTSKSEKKAGSTAESEKDTKESTEDETDETETETETETEDEAKG